MVVRRSDSRRRRLVVDPSQTTSQVDEEGAPVSSSKKTTAKTKKELRAYSYGADRRNVSKTTDLFPKRAVSYLLVLLALLACLGLINYGAIQAQQWRAQIGDLGVSSLAVSGLGSIGNWFTSLLLILSSLSCLQIFALRKHRCDDYRGTYQIWVWLAGVLLLGSLCCSVDFTSIARYTVESLTQVSFFEKPWLAPAIVISLLAILFARAIFEVRRSRGSMAWFSAALVGFTVAALLQLHSVSDSVLMEFDSKAMTGNCILFATSALLMAHLTYVRFVFLRAHGLIKLKVKKKKAAKPKRKARTTAKTTAKPKAKAKPAKAKPVKAKSKTKAKPKAKTKAKPKSKSEEAAPVKSRRKTAAKPADPAPVATETKQAKKVAAKKPKSAAVKSAAAKNDKQRTSQDLLKELAAASRAKENAQSGRAAHAEEDEHEGIIKMSKSERRKQRREAREARNRKRAA